MTLTLAIRNSNGASHLAGALRSISSQNAPVRWWLHDTQSSDESLELARALARPSDTIICEKDQGEADGLNKAFSRMGGDIVGFLGSNDTLHPDAAQLILNEFETHPNMDIFVGAVQCIDENGKPLRVHQANIQSLEDILDIYNVWWKERQFVRPGIFWRRQFWDKVGPFKTNYHHAFDYDYWVRCFQARARIGYTSAILADCCVRQNPSDSIATAAEIRTVLQAALKEPMQIDILFRWKLQHRLSYDRYQCGQDLPPRIAPPAFIRTLLRNPGWLFVPEVQTRLRALIRKRLNRLFAKDTSE